MCFRNKKDKQVQDIEQECLRCKEFLMEIRDLEREIQINKIHSDSPKKMMRALNNFDINSFKSPFYLSKENI